YQEAMNASEYREAAEATGIVPVAYGRYGLPHGIDLGVMASGTLFRLTLRREHVFEEGTTRPAFIYGISPYAGYIASQSSAARGHRTGVELPLVFAID